jgi:hypothetical protein
MMLSGHTQRGRPAVRLFAGGAVNYVISAYGHIREQCDVIISGDSAAHPATAHRRAAEIVVVTLRDRATG